MEYTPELGDRICAALADGKSLRSVCRLEGMPSKSAVFSWLREHEAFAKNYAVAVSDRADAVFEEMFEIADDASNDFLAEKIDGGTEGGAGGEAGAQPDPSLYVYKFRKEHVQRSRLRIETRKWALARMNPKKYGDKMTAELTGAEGGPITVELVRFSDKKKQGSDGGAGSAPA